MKISLDELLESEGPFMILTKDRYNALKGEVGRLKYALEKAEASNDFLRRHIRKLEDYIDETADNS